MLGRRLLSVLRAFLAVPAAAEELALVGARVYAAPDAAPLDDATILVRDGRIAAVGPRSLIAVPAATRVVQARGLVATAGFWNSHIHLITPPYHEPDAQPAADLSKALHEQFTRWGFTTLFDVASLPGDVRALRARIQRGEVTGPRLLTVDMPFYPEHGTPIYVRDLWARYHVPSAEVATPAQGRVRAAAQLDAGADGVKLFSGAIVGGAQRVLQMPPAIGRAIVDEAHARHKPAFAHPTDSDGLLSALDSGVDVLAHTAPDAGAWSPELVARLKTQHVALIPTLTLFESEPRREGAPEAVVTAFVGKAQGQLKAASEGGVDVLFGTDAGYMQIFDTRREYQLMTAAGLDWRQILASLTTTPARRFGDAAHAGRIAPGMAADIVLLGSDPAADAEAFADVRLTVRDGKVIHDAMADSSP
ncbi:MAG TPA: amidohydrolase family protein [Stenotrophomonas sp.]|nr:amidohydrolase family protein [Stenotrophomonas sp.]